MGKDLWICGEKTIEFIKNNIFKIDRKIFEAFPDFIAGVLIVTDADNHGSLGDKNLFSGIEKLVGEKFPSAEQVGQSPFIDAWRSAYKKFGADPHRYRCSSEALVRQVLKGNSIRGINKMVDIYNYVSLKYTFPVGGEDIDKIQGNARLTFAEGNEEFIRLGGTENESPAAGEVIYRDDAGVICRMWNWREGERTKLTESTKNAVIVIDALAPADERMVRQALDEMAELIKKHCDGKTICSVIRG